jgi:hypothetical protein
MRPPSDTKNLRLTQIAYYSGYAKDDRVGEHADQGWQKMGAEIISTAKLISMLM